MVADFVSPLDLCWGFGADQGGGLLESSLSWILAKFSGLRLIYLNLREIKNFETMNREAQHLLECQKEQLSLASLRQTSYRSHA